MLQVLYYLTFAHWRLLSRSITVLRHTVILYLSNYLSESSYWCTARIIAFFTIKSKTNDVKYLFIANVMVYCGLPDVRNTKVNSLYSLQGTSTFANDKKYGSGPCPSSTLNLIFTFIPNIFKWNRKWYTNLFPSHTPVSHILVIFGVLFVLWMSNLVVMRWFRQIGHELIKYAHIHGQGNDFGSF